MAFAAGQDRDARAFFGGEGREGVAQRDGGRGIDGVALRRPVDGDDGNRAIAHDENGHGISSDREGWVVIPRANMMRGRSAKPREPAWETQDCGSAGRAPSTEERRVGKGGVSTMRSRGT